MSAHAKVLLVEGKPNHVSTALKKTSWSNQTLEINDGVEALNYLRAQERVEIGARSLPVVVLLSVRLPRLSGLEVLRELKEASDFRSVPVVMLGDRPDDRLIDECYRLGANGYVVKPIESKALIKIVEQTISFWANCNELPP